VIEFLENDLPIPDIGLAFIYCDYTKYKSQTIKYFIGTIVRQLVEQRSAITEDVRLLHKKYRRKGTPPSITEYLELLQSLARASSEVYLIIDALDECIDNSRESIWGSLLTKLKISVPNLRLLCTSRYISDIGGRLKNSTRIEIRARDVDINTYILAQIESKDRLLGLCEEDDALKDEILVAVGSNTEGM